MRFSRACFTAVAFLLVSLVVQSFSELVIRHEPYQTEGYKLTCISEDDNGAALTWNYDPLKHRAGIADFMPRVPTALGKLNDCAVRNASNCLAGWDTTKDWDIKRSIKKPQGPIFDHRWEGLMEYNFKEHVNHQTYQNVGKVKSSGSMWFSARGINDLYIYMCKNENPPAAPCIWVLIAGWDGKESVIDHCASGAREPNGPEKKCRPISEYHAQQEPNKILDLYEWRTFKIEWDSENKTVKVFKSDVSEPFLFGRISEWPEEFYVSVRSEEHGRIRFHLYDYYFTETNDAVITTKEFAHSGKIFHAELLVSLCQKCILSVRLVDKHNHNIETWTASGVEINSHSDLLTWQSIKLITTLDNDYLGDIKLEIRTILDENAGVGRWVIDNFRVYEAGGQTRRSNLTLPSLSEKVTCQKLSYTGVGEIVSSSVHKLGSSGVKSKLQNFIYRHKEQDIGMYGYMCNAKGCTCGRGFVREYCGYECVRGFYGYDCGKKCGSCENFAKCDSKTGFCHKGCQGHKIAPFCETDLEAPTVENIEDQGVTVIQKIELDTVVVTSANALIVEMEVNPQVTGGTKPTKATTLELKRSENSPIFKGSITGLKLSTVYKVRTVLTATLGDQSTPSTTFSPEKNFSTTCYGKSKFEIVPDERSFTVQEWNKNCTIETSKNRWHMVTIDASTNKTVGITDLFTSVPYEKTDLEPAKNYTVIIRDTKLNVTWILPQIQTSESAPSEVQDLNAESTNTTITVRWNPPLNPNGRITQYSVTIKLRYFKGCQDYGENTPSEEAVVQKVAETTTIFENLHPYATYVVFVKAHNSKEGISDEITCDTKSNGIPTSMVRNLRFNKTTNRIEWDNPDCTTVTGLENVTKVLLRREVDKLWNVTRFRDINTTFLILREFGFDPYIQYRVRVHVTRCYQCPENPHLYQDKQWQSNPAAPPAVRNLTIYEVDSKTVSLQWMPPEPANGELESYVISIGGKRKLENSSITLNVTEITYCNHREGFLCYENFELPPDAASSDMDIQIEVFAKNKDVEEIGTPVAFKLRQEFFEQAPSKPVQVEVYRSRTPGGVTIKWRRPWWSPTKIARYSIRIVFVKTDLLDDIAWSNTCWWPVYLENSNQDYYTTNLSLFPSTTYHFSITSVSERNRSSTEVSFYYRVPESVGFDGELDLLQESQSSIEVKVPRIINATRNTWVKITVQGIRTCVDHHSQTPSSTGEQTSWIAKWYQVETSEERKSSVSGNSYVYQSSNCFFRIGEPYKIIINVLNGTSNSRLLEQIETSSGMTLVPEEPQKSNLAWLLVIPILIIFVLLAFVIKYRKREKCPLLDSARSQTVSNSSIPWNLKDTSVPLPVLVPVSQPKPKSTPDVIPFNPLSHPVGIDDFEEYTKDGLKSGLLTSQYEEFPKGLTKPCDYGRLPANASKNRWANLIAYDDTRVVLETLEDPYSDYINASYIPGYQNEKAYIATQGPKPETINDFWRMVWQEKVRVICMLANVIEHGRTKCVQYWPDIGDQILHGDILVSNMNQVVYINYTIRTFEVKLKKNKREVTHLHYTGWPDHGVPMFTQSVVPYLKKLQATATGNEPIVVHCSAGVGRTGTIILCDTALRQAKSEMVVDLAAVTERMRKYRARMVDNEQQYVFAHLAIVEYMLSEETEIPCNEYSNGRINDARKLLIAHIERVRNIIWGERVMQSIGEPTSPLPDDVARDGNMELDLADPSMGLFGPVMKSYVNRKHVQTVSIDGSKIENQFLMTWLPSPSTRSEIWELIADDNIELVIVLQRPDEKDPTCCDLMPSESNPISSRSVEVEFKGCFEEDEDYIIDKVFVSKNSEIAKEPQSVTVITCHGWGRGAEGKPPSVGALVSLWMASEKVSRSESPTLVLCHDGVTGCGLYVALSFLLERIAVEKECDVISAVRKVRRSKPEFGQSIKEFDYLYDAALNYVDRFKLYANYS